MPDMWCSSSRGSRILFLLPQQMLRGWQTEHNIHIHFNLSFDENPSFPFLVMGSLRCWHSPLEQLFISPEWQQVHGIFSEHHPLPRSQKTVIKWMTKHNNTYRKVCSYLTASFCRKQASVTQSSLHIIAGSSEMALAVVETDKIRTVPLQRMNNI